MEFLEDTDRSGDYASIELPSSHEDPVDRQVVGDPVAIKMKVVESRIRIQENESKNWIFLTRLVFGCVVILLILELISSTFYGIGERPDIWNMIKPVVYMIVGGVFVSRRQRNGQDSDYQEFE